MKITNLIYERKYSTAPYENHTLTIGATIEEGEDTSEAFDQLKDKIESWHLANQIAEESKKRVVYDLEPVLTKNFETISIHEPTPEPDPTEIGIREATTMDELRPFKKAAMQNGLLIIYMNKMKKLTIEEHDSTILKTKQLTPKTI